MESPRNQVGSADRTMGLRGLLHTASTTRLPRLFDYALQRRCDHGRQRDFRSGVALEPPTPWSMSEMAIYRHLTLFPVSEAARPFCVVARRGPVQFNAASD